MPSTSILHDIPGGKPLLEWFGRIPRFHDAKLLEITLGSNGTGLLRIHAWNMTDEVDAKGEFVLDNHAIVTITLEGVSAINCTDSIWYRASSSIWRSPRWTSISALTGRSRRGLAPLL